MLVILAFWRAAAGVQGQSGLKSETLSQKQNKKKYLRVWAVLFIYFFFFNQSSSILDLYPKCLLEHSIPCWEFSAYSSF